MRVELLNTVLLAEDYERLRDWYVAALGLELQHEAEADYHYAELGQDGRCLLGIAVATEMGTTPGDRTGGTVLPQFNTDDLRAFLARVQSHGGTIVYGPKHEEGTDFWYGAFLDIEGNQGWVVQLPHRLTS